jgi:outer membrane receptor for ferrienterochelin and colicins
MNTQITRRLWLTAALVGALTLPARAQTQTETADQPIADLTLEQIARVEVNTVFGASRYLQKVTDAPSAVTIVTHDEIERFGYQTLADILRGVRGFYVSNDRNYTYLGVRGFSRPGDYNTRLLMLIDGHRMNETVYDLALFGNEFPLDLALIERVEVVRGPSSSLYGTSAFFAVVNVVTKKAAAIRSLQASVEGGTLSTGKLEAAYGRETQGGTEFVVGGSGFASKGDSNFSVPGLGVARDMDTDSGWNLFGSAARGRWSVTALTGWREKRIPTGAFGVVLDDRRSLTQDQRSYVEAMFDGSWKGNGIVWRGSADHYGYYGGYVYEYDPGVHTLYKDSAHSDWWSTDVMLTRRVARRHFLTGGLEFRDNFRQEQVAYDEDPYQLHLDQRGSSRVGAIYIQDELTLSPRVTISAGLRHDWNTVSEDATNVRFAAIVKPLPEASVKVLHGTAFRAPNPYELYYFPNPDGLRPERIRTTEVIWEQYAQRRFRASVSGFLYRAKDLISQVPVPDTVDDFIFANVDEARAVGVELEAEYAWRSIHALGSYTFQDVRSYPDDQTLSNSPRHLSRVRVTGPIVSRLLFFGAEGLYTGDRFTLGGGVAEGAFLGNLTLTTRELSRAKLSLTIGNLFNRAYADPGAEEHPGDVIPQPGRTLRAKLSWRF